MFHNPPLQVWTITILAMLPMFILGFILIRRARATAKVTRAKEDQLPAFQLAEPIVAQSTVALFSHPIDWRVKQVPDCTPQLCGVAGLMACSSLEPEQRFRLVSFLDALNGSGPYHETIKQLRVVLPPLYKLRKELAIVLGTERFQSKLKLKQSEHETPDQKSLALRWAMASDTMVLGLCVKYANLLDHISGRCERINFSAQTPKAVIPRSELPDQFTMQCLEELRDTLLGTPETHQSQDSAGRSLQSLHG